MCVIARPDPISLFLMSFRRSEATEKSKDPSLHSGYGFLPSVEMTKKKSNYKEEIEMTKMAVVQRSQDVRDCKT